MARHDRRGEPLGERRGREVLAERAVHAAALVRIERQVGHVARERVAEVDGVALAVAEPAREEARERLVVVEAREREEIASRASGPPATASQSTTSCSAAGSSCKRSAMSCSSVEGSGSLRSPGRSDANQRVAARPCRLADLERAALEQRVDHLEQEERVARDLGHQIGEHLGRRLRARRGATARAAPARRR